MKRKRTVICLVSAVAACIIAATGLFAAYRCGAFLPGWIEWGQGQVAGECTEEPESIQLERGDLWATLAGETVWSIDSAVRVQNFLYCDIDRDGARELLVLCWSWGRYGESRPFWVERDECGWFQHIYIYRWEGDGMRPIWMASDIGREVGTWYFDETERLVITDRKGTVTAWDWRSWGLENIPLVRTLTFAALGDNLIHRQLYDYVFRRCGGDFGVLYSSLADELAGYDVTAIQQEGLYVEKPEQYASYPLLGTPAQVGEALADAGFSVVSCAGNHSLDFGTEAIDRTVEFFKSRGILCPGVQSSSEREYQPYQALERNGIRCAFLGFTETTNGHRLPEEAPYVLNTLDDEKMVRSAVGAAREAADLVVVFVHWGDEYSTEPNDSQRRWAKLFADCGADVVIGTHPHVLQNWEWVTGDSGRSALVYYSLGNCISAQTQEECRVGGLAWFEVEMSDDACEIVNCGMKRVETLEENGKYSVALEQ